MMCACVSGPGNLLSVTKLTLWQISYVFCFLNTQMLCQCVVICEDVSNESLPDDPIQDGDTLLHIASQCGHPATALTLLKKGVLLHMPNKVLDTFIYFSWLIFSSLNAWTQLFEIIQFYFSYQIGLDHQKKRKFSEIRYNHIAFDSGSDL